jgi:predicted type IV restriction endonuclease
MSVQQLTLTGATDTIRKRIQQIRDRKEIIGEQNTKAALIDPLLAALGWDLQEIEEVRREYRRKPQDNPVDYALFLNRTECLFIEAKSLEKDLNDRKWTSQNLSYATVVGVRWCVLTNGDEYRIYNAHAPVDVEEKLFRSVRVSDCAETRHLVDTLHLLSKEQMRGRLLDELWKGHFIDRNVKHALDDLIANEDGGLVRTICKKTKGVLTHSEVRASLKRAKISVDFPAPPAAIVSESSQNRDEPTARGSRHEAGKKAWETMVAMSDASLRHLIEAGFVRAPLAVERDYKGVHLMAAIQADGSVVVEGKTYDSLSAAAGMARTSVTGAPPKRPYPPTNGWQFWCYRDSDTGELRTIDFLRQKYLAPKPGAKLKGT